MLKSVLYISEIIMISMIVCLCAYSQENMTIIDNKAFKNPQRPPSLFKHDAHNEKAQVDECNLCHHSYDDKGIYHPDESSEEQSCSDCHQEEGNKMHLMKAFHIRCKGCHIDKNAGPVMCGECHINRKY